MGKHLLPVASPLAILFPLQLLLGSFTFFLYHLLFFFTTYYCFKCTFLLQLPTFCYVGFFCSPSSQYQYQRVNPFDAARLDIEMSAMLKEQMVKVFSLMKVFHLVGSRFYNSNCTYTDLDVSAGNPLKLFLPFIDINQECYFDTKQSLMRSSSFLFGGSQFG